MKRILTVQDISCVGKCSLTVALPVLAAMGLETAVLPTAVLSTHTGFPNPSFRDLTDGIAQISAHWQQVGVSFDGVCTGYLGSREQVAQILALAEQFCGDGSMLFVDPVMGDNGKLYAGIDAGLPENMAQLCARADVIMPNITEACFLTQTPYRETCDEAYIHTLLERLAALGCKVALITGVSFSAGTTGVAGYEKTGKTFFRYTQEKLPQSYHGTGDIFSSVCAGAMLLGRDWRDAIRLAADYTAECIRQTGLQDRDKRYGVCFEKAIGYLLKKLEQ